MPLATLLREQLSSREAFSKASSLRVRRNPVETDADPPGYAAGGGGDLRPGAARLLRLSSSAVCLTLSGVLPLLLKAATVEPSSRRSIRTSGSRISTA